MNRLKTFFILTSSLLSLSTTLYAAAPAAPTTAAAPATAPTVATDAETTKIEGIVHQYLVQHPEVLVEAMQALQQKQMDQTQQTIKQTQQLASNFANNLFHQKNDPAAGNPNGAITVVEFFDYQCPHCIDMAPTLSAIVKANPNVRVIYKEFPIRGPISEFAAQATLAANLQGKYLALHNALLASTTQPLTQDAILKMAASAGIDVAKLKRDMTAPAVTDQLKGNMKLAEDLKLFGTPALFIGKSNIVNTPANNQASQQSNAILYVPGQMDQTQLQQAIDQQSKTTA